MLRNRVCLVVVPIAALLAGCELFAPSSRCERDDQCPQGYRCDRVEQVCAADTSDAAKPDSGATDAGALDVVAVDGMGRDQALTDLVGRDSAPRDGGVPDQATGGDRRLLDGARVDRWSPDAARDDTDRADAAWADGCSSLFGHYCQRTDYCGATYDCAGQCAGGESDPGCPQCGSRMCENLATWGACEGSSCDVHTMCTPSGYCVCSGGDCDPGFCNASSYVPCEYDSYGCPGYGVEVACPKGCGGYPPACLSDLCPADTECRADNGTCVDGTLATSCGQYGSTCTDCTALDDTCAGYECLGGGCVMTTWALDGTTCDTNSRCWNGVCTDCNSFPHQTCRVWCPDCSSDTAGRLTCDNRCLVSCNCYSHCQGLC